MSSFAGSIAPDLTCLGTTPISAGKVKFPSAVPYSFSTCKPCRSFSKTLIPHTVLVNIATLRWSIVVWWVRIVNRDPLHCQRLGYGNGLGRLITGIYSRLILNLEGLKNSPSVKATRLLGNKTIE